MKAAIVEKPGVLTVKEIPMPEVGEYDALCDLLYGATCTGTDQHLIAGRFPWPVQYPTILGHESVGRVVEVGAKVRYFKVGDLITRVGAPPVGEYGVNWGGFAEYGIARDHRAMLTDGVDRSQWGGYRVNQVIPPGIDPAGATMLITWRETLSYLTRMGMGEGASVLVVGSGGNGLSFAAHAANAGATQVVVLGNAEREAAARAVGATGYVDYRAGDVTAQLNGFCSDGFDFIIDAVGQATSADAVLLHLKRGGTLGVYGIDDYTAVHVHPLRARGTFAFYNGGYDEAETHERVVALVQAGKLNASVWLDLAHPYALDDIRAAFEAVRARKMVKAVVRLSE
jgi:2-desacetyl-2-hydroxyethyl bacteriochlorophyllide A dehydrogenase